VVIFRTWKYFPAILHGQFLPSNFFTLKSYDERFLRYGRGTVLLAAFVFKLYGASRAFLTSQWRNLTVGQIMLLPNYVIVTSKTLWTLHGAWKRMRPLGHPVQREITWFLTFGVRHWFHYNELSKTKPFFSFKIIHGNIWLFLRFKCHF